MSRDDGRALKPLRRRGTGRWLLVAALVATPSLVFSQRGMGRGNSAGGKSESSNTAPPPQQLIVNSVNILIGHRQELALTDSQVVEIVRVKRSLDSVNVPLMRRLDSLQDVLQPRRRFPVPDQSDSRGNQPGPPPQEQIAETLDLIRGNIRPARDSAFSLLTPAQRDRASSLEMAAQQRVDALLKQATPQP